jgi:hypothetical protein
VVTALGATAMGLGAIAIAGAWPVGGAGGARTPAFRGCLRAALIAHAAADHRLRHAVLITRLPRPSTG